MGPTKLTATTCHGLLAYSLHRPASPGRRPCLYCRTLSRTSCPILDQYHRSCNLASTLWTPAWACLWAFQTNSRHMAAGKTTLFFSGCLLFAAKVMDPARSAVSPNVDSIAVTRHTLASVALHWVAALPSWPDTHQLQLLGGFPEVSVDP